MVSVFDRGARDGEGLFETLRVYAGQPFQWSRHLERLVVSAAELGFAVPPSPTSLREGLDALLHRTGFRDAASRITVTRGVPGGGGRRTRTGSWMDVEPIAARLWKRTRTGARLVYSRQPFEPGPLGRPRPPADSPTIWRGRIARGRADEALLVSAPVRCSRARTAISSRSKAGREHTTTPAGIPPGIARATVPPLCRVWDRAQESVLTRRDLTHADEIFMTTPQEIVTSVRWRIRSSPPEGAVGCDSVRLPAAVAREIERGGLPPTVA
jgi:branched-subunit amino acid aminotransferase/4-amino-4-deoxychorismate lyase